MKLQKHLAYKYKDKKHYKHVVVIPEEIIEELGWHAGIELKRETEGKALIIKPIDREQTREEKKV